MKKCIKCLLEKSIDDFYKGKSSCKVCYSIYCKNWKSNNKEKLKLYDENYKNNNPEKVKAKQIKYRNNHKEKIKEYHKEYDKHRIYDTNKEKERRLKYKENNILYQKEYRLNNKDKRKIYKRNRINNDPLFKLSLSIRGLIYNSFYEKGLKKNSKTEQILGCTILEFKDYIENKLDVWMNWNNKGLYNGEFNYGWDIDHIIPLSSAKTKEELLKLNHYSNLQPLCSKINRDIKKDLINEYI